MAEGPEARDSELLRWLAAGDEKSFTLLYRRYQGELYRFALYMTGSPESAADVVQETFLAVIRGDAKFDPARGAAPAFLFGIARNHVRRLQAKDSRFVPLPDSDIESLTGLSNGNGNGNGSHLATSVGGTETEQADLSRDEIVQRLRAAVARLPEHYREVVTLCDLQGKSYEQAAALLDCPIGTVRSRLNRARDLLMEKMSAKNSVGENAATSKAVRSTGR
jgi:RNA polymerase sigma-70 factor (ECF subfamily)